MFDDEELQEFLNNEDEAEDELLSGDEDMMNMPPGATVMVDPQWLQMVQIEMVKRERTHQVMLDHVDMLKHGNSKLVGQVQAVKQKFGSLQAQVQNMVGTLEILDKFLRERCGMGVHDIEEFKKETQLAELNAARNKEDGKQPKQPPDTAEPPHDGTGSNTQPN